LLWLGRLTKQKGLEHLLDLAECCPELQFDLVGDTNTDSSYARRIIKRAGTLSNVVMHGRVPHSAVDSYYRQAAAMLCTSDWEGFPNTFVEAWSRGVPVATRWDADDLVSGNNLGVVAANVESLARKTRKLISSQVEWEACSRRARAFYLKNHTVEATAEAYERLFNQELALGTKTAGDAS